MTFKKGKSAWNKGLTGKEYKLHYENGFGGTFVEGHEPHNKGIVGWMKGHIGYMLGKKQTEKTKQKISEALTGRKLSEEHKLNMSLSRRGENCCNWKGGITLLTYTIRHNFKYRQWHDDVFTRDNFTCQECGQIGGKLNAHHIKSFAAILEEYGITTLEYALDCDELWNINNGITLCEECHRELYKS